MPKPSILSQHRHAKRNLKIDFGVYNAFSKRKENRCVPFKVKLPHTSAVLSANLLYCSAVMLSKNMQARPVDLDPQKSTN